MSTGAKAILRVAAATGVAIPGETVERYARRLREHTDDAWPSGGRGGGKNAPHIQRHHAANLLMSFAAAAPIEGPRAVVDLRPLRRTSTQTVYRMLKQEPDTPTRLGGQVRDERDADPVIFGDRLEQLIQDAAFPNTTTRVLMDGLEVSLSVEPARAEIVWQSSNSITTEIFEQPGHPLASDYGMPPKRPTRRVVFLNEDVIMAAGEVWADTVRAGRAVQPNTSSTTERLAHAE